MKLKKGNNQLQEDEFRRLYQVKAEKFSISTTQPLSKHLFPLLAEPTLSFVNLCQYLTTRVRKCVSISVPTAPL